MAVVRNSTVYILQSHKLKAVPKSASTIVSAHNRISYRYEYNSAPESRAILPYSSAVRVNPRQIAVSYLHPTLVRCGTG